MLCEDKKIMKKIITTLFLLFLTLPLFAESIKLKNGRTVEAKIIEKTDDAIKVDILGIRMTYYFSDIESIDGQLIYAPKSYPIPDRQIKEKIPKEIFKLYSPAVVYINTDKGFGSGFIIDKHGTVVTNYHVVALANDISVILKNEERYKPTTIIAYSILEDLCVLKINASYDLPFIPLGDSDAVEVGDDVLTIGNPMGFNYSLSDGLASRLSEGIYRKIIQFTAPISSGSSGGPLLNNKGEAIGINTQVILPTDGIFVTQNINFAVVINELKDLISRRRNLSLEKFFELERTKHSLTRALYSPGYAQEILTVFETDLNTKCISPDDEYCFILQIEYLRINASLLSNYMDKILKGTAANSDLVMLRDLSIEAIKVIGDAGGLDKIAERYQFYLHASDSAIRNTYEYTLLVPFYTASAAYALLGDEKKAKNYYDQLDKHRFGKDWCNLLDLLFEDTKNK